MEKTFKVGDVILIHTKYRNITEVRAGHIRSLKNGLFGYTGTFLTDFHPTGQGAFTVESIGAKPFGLQRVEVINHIPMAGIYATCSPRPGDTGYDLMC
jgi:hypothetical protein